MKKNAFTLVELIGVITIISIVLLIGVPVYNAIRKQVLERQYKNVVSLIETKAIKYAEENKVLIMSVDTLIKSGYLDADKGTIIYNPINNSSLNCYAVLVEYNNSYKASLITSKEYIKNNTCDEEALIADNSSLKILVDGNSVTNDSWFNKDIVLSAKLNNNEISTGTFTWVSSNGEQATGSQINVKATKLLGNTYTLRYKDVNDNNYVASLKINIDKEMPYIYPNTIEGIDNSNWVKLMNIKLKATDYNGSGIKGYYIGIDSCAGKNYNNPSQQYEQELRLNGKYNLCVSDNAGNIYEYPGGITISKVDDIKPSCVVNKTNSLPSTSGVNTTVTCTDNESGVETCDMGDTSLTNNKMYYVSDKAGNTSTCSVDVTEVTMYKGTYPNYSSSSYWSDCASGSNTCQAGNVCQGGYNQVWDSCATGSNTCQSGYVCQGGYNQVWDSCATGSNTCQASNVCQGGYNQVWDSCASWECPNEYNECRDPDCGCKEKECIKWKETCTDVCIKKKYYYDCCTGGCHISTNFSGINPSPSQCSFTKSECVSWGKKCSKSCSKEGTNCETYKSCRAQGCGINTSCKVKNRICQGGYVQGSYDSCLTSTYDSCATGSNTCQGGYVQGSYDSCYYSSYSSCATGSNTCQSGYVQSSYDPCYYSSYSSCATGSNTCQGGYVYYSYISSYSNTDWLSSKSCASCTSYVEKTFYK